MEKVVLHNKIASDAFDCLKELIDVMTYERGGMREATIKQLDYIKSEYSRLERENCGLRQTNFNLHKKIDSKYSSGTPWNRSAEVEKVSHE